MPTAHETKVRPIADLKILDGGSGGFSGYASVFDELDRAGDIVAKGAYHDTLPQFVERGFIGWSHDWSQPVATIKAAREDTRGLFLEAEFHSDAQSQVARTRTMERLARGKTMGLSIGYLPVEWDRTDKGRLLTKIDLFETSLVTVPALASAGVTMAKSGTNPASAAGDTEAKAGRRLSAASITRVRAAMETLRELLGETAAAGDADEADDGGPSGGKGSDGETAAEHKAAIAAHSTGTSGGSWDGPANERRLPNEPAVLKRSHAWMDPDGDPGTKAAYRFIHHDVSADGRVGAANLTACSTGIAVLNGGRGGTTIPTSDRSGVWSHLARHLRDGSKEPPPLKAANLSMLDAGEHVLADLAEYTYRLANAADEDALIVRDYAGGIRKRLALTLAALDGALARATASGEMHPAELRRRFEELERRLGLGVA